MKVTNKNNLPQAFVNAVNVKRHNRSGEFSATTLNKGIKEIVLADRHFDEIEIEASDNVWAVFGNAVHEIMEKQEDGNFHEEKFRVGVLHSVVTGQVDSYDMENGIIFDWKTASVWKVQFEDFDDWKKQGLTYAWLLKQSGLDVKKCRFVAFLKDHSKTKARTDKGYPQLPVHVYEFDVTADDLKATEERIYQKVQALELARTLEDNDIPPCTKEERWADGEKWAVMKAGRKSAVKLFDSEEEANAMAEENGKGYFVEHRPAISRKCGDYCNVCRWCNFYKNEMGDE